MPTVDLDGRAFCVEVDGPVDGAPVLLLSGLGMQLTRWSPRFVDLVAARGLRVVRMDNRDAGLSWGPDVPPPPIGPLVEARREGRIPEVPYRLEEMADDAAGVLAALGIDAAHVAGASMGGMIGQLLAVRHPERVMSLVSIMSTTGADGLPGPTEAAQAVLNARRPDPVTERAAFLDVAVAHARILGSPGFPTPDAVLRARMEADLDRAFRPDGVARQYAAIIGSGPRDTRLAGLSLPAMAIHGADDPLIPPEGGRATAEAIPGAELLEIPGMGHDLPEALEEMVADAIARTAARAA